MMIDDELRYEVESHLRHMTDGRWHDDCQYCRKRRLHGGTGVPDDILEALAAGTS